MLGEERYARQIALFGAEGQRRLEQLVVGIVGLGGLGSHVAQQAAYLGVKRYVLVDHDTLSESNVNRSIGAYPDDLEASPRKVSLAERLIRRIQPDSSLMPVPERLESPRAREALAAVDVIVGCVDGDLARLDLTDIAARLGRPYLDLATDTGEDNGRSWYGGHCVFAGIGNGCLSCLGLLDQRAMARAAMGEEERAADNRSYGVPRALLDQTGPAVVAINGVVASLGVTELMAWATRLRDPWGHLVYRGDLGRVSLNKDAPTPDCYYCHTLWGKG